MNANPVQNPTQELHNLCEQATALVRNLPSPMLRVVVRSVGYSVEVEWPAPHESAASGTVGAAPTPPAAATGESMIVVSAAAPPAAAETIDPGHIVRAPLVGTFYRTPQPDAAPFVSVGDVVEAGQTIAIVEAMKLMNPISADVDGRVVEIYLDNDEPVEFEQPLLRIAPAMHVAAVTERVA